MESMNQLISAIIPPYLDTCLTHRYTNPSHDHDMNDDRSQAQLNGLYRIIATRFLLNTFSLKCFIETVI